MDVSIEREQPRVISVRLAGRLESSAWRAALSEVAGHLTPDQQSAILIDAQQFEGFGPGNWDDMWFQMKHDRDISRMAIVGPPQWEERVLMFAGQGLRAVDIRYFRPEQREQALKWASMGENERVGER